MAKSTKARAQASTSLTQDTSEAAALARAAIHSNEPNVPSDDSALQNAEIAFASKVESETKESSATQRLAYAVQCHYAHMVMNDDKPPAMEAVHKGGDAFGALKRAMVLFFLGEERNTDGMDADDARRVNKTRTNRIRLLERAIKFAALLSTLGITFDSFSEKQGNYAIPVGLLFREGEGPLTELKGMINVRLDNDVYGAELLNAEGKLRSTNVQASVARLFAAHTVKETRKPRQAGADQDKAGAAKSTDGSSPDEVIGDSGPTVRQFEAMVQHVRSALVMGRNDAPGLVTKDAYDDATWNALADIAQWYQAVTSSPNFNKPTKPARKAKANAA